MFSGFLGLYEVAVDEKGRIAIPARFRQTFAEHGDLQLVMTTGPSSCIEIYPAEEFQRVADDIQRLEDRAAAELLQQVFIGFAAEAEIDKQGRVLLPTLLRKRAGLNGTAVVSGRGRRFDVWSAERWNERFGDGPGNAFEQAASAYLQIRR